MTRQDFVAGVVIAAYGGWMANPALEGSFRWEYNVTQANLAADALYGPEEQVESDEMRELREAFVDACNWLDQITDDPTYAPSTGTLRSARAALDGYRGMYNECRRVLRGEDDDAS